MMVTLERHFFSLLQTDWQFFSSLCVADNVSVVRQEYIPTQQSAEVTDTPAQVFCKDLKCFFSFSSAYRPRHL